MPQGHDLERHEGQIAGVRAPHPDLPRAEFAPLRPAEPARVEWPLPGRPQPEVPLEVRRDRLLALGRLLLVGAAAGVPDVDFPDVAQDAIFDQLDAAPELPAGGALVAHLGGDLLLLRRLAHPARFVDAAGHRFLDEGVLAGLHRGHTGDGVGMVRRGDDDAVDLLLHLVEHLAEIVERGDVGVFPAGRLRLAVVHVAEGHDVRLPGHHVRVPLAAAADADEGDVELRVGGVGARRAAVGEDQHACAERGLADEVAAGDPAFHLRVLLTTTSPGGIRGAPARRPPRC